MKRILVLSLLSLLGFAAGLGGVYLFKLKTQPPPTETAPADTLSAADALAELAGSDMAHLVTLDLPVVQTDSLDSLRVQLEAAQQVLPELLARLDTLQAALQRESDRRARVEALAGTLTRLEGTELRSLLGRLDADVLADVYSASNARARTKLLEHLPATRGASLVERIASGDRRAIPVSAMPSSAALPQTDAPAETDPAAAEADRPAGPSPSPSPERPATPERPPPAASDEAAPGSAPSAEDPAPQSAEALVDEPGPASY